MAMTRPWSARAYPMCLLSASVLVLLFVSGCNSPQNQGKSPQAVSSAQIEDFPKLQKQLFELATSEKTEEYVKRSNIEYKDGRVQIVIEVSGTEWIEDVVWAIDALDGQIETKLDTLVQARVSPDALLKLAKHPRVIFIRLPARPEK